MKSILALVFLVIAGLVGTLMFRLGSFKPVSIHEGPHESMKVIYKQHVGAYHKIVPVLEEVETWAKAHDEPCELSFGEYYDDPDKTVEDRLRSNGGCLVAKKPEVEMPAGFMYREIPAHTFVIAEFDGAPSIGPMKVYPHATDYIREHGLVKSGPTYEIYKILPQNQVQTTYLFPVVKAGSPDTSPVGAADYRP